MNLNQIGSLEGGKQVFWAALLWAVAWTSWGQTASISGSVVDAEARYPLMGATVQVLTVPDKVTAADLDGRFKLEDVPLGATRCRCPSWATSRGCWKASC